MDVKVERARQDGKWGEQNHWPSWYYLILAEEVGEVAKAILEHREDEVRAELVQVAAVAVAMIESLDRDNAHDKNWRPNGKNKNL